MTRAHTGFSKRLLLWEIHWRSDSLLLLVYSVEGVSAIGSITEAKSPIRSANQPAAQRYSSGTLQRATDPAAQFALLSDEQRVPQWRWGSACLHSSARATARLFIQDTNDRVHIRGHNTDRQMLCWRQSQGGKASVTRKSWWIALQSGIRDNRNKIITTELVARTDFFHHLPWSTKRE